MGIELTDFRTSSKRAGTLSGDRSTGQHHCFFVSFVVLSFHLANLVQEGAKSSISINLAKTVCLALTFSWYSITLNLLTLAAAFPKGFQGHHTQHLASACTAAFSKQPQAWQKWWPASAHITAFPKWPKVWPKWRQTHIHISILPKFPQDWHKCQWPQLTL